MYVCKGRIVRTTDQLEGGLTEIDALEVVRLLDQTSIDLIDISGGTYFPGAKASSESSSEAPYFLDFGRLVKGVTNVPVMLTGGFKKRDQAVDAVASGAADIVGIARAMALNPRLSDDWLTEQGGDPEFPEFEFSPPSGVTAWYTMRLTALAEGRESMFELDLPSAIREYEERDAQRIIKWRNRLSHLALTVARCAYLYLSTVSQATRAQVSTNATPYLNIFVPCETFFSCFRPQTTATPRSEMPNVS